MSWSSATRSSWRSCVIGCGRWPTQKVANSTAARGLMAGSWTGPRLCYCSWIAPIVPPELPGTSKLWACPESRPLRTAKSSLPRKPGRTSRCPRSPRDDCASRGGSREVLGPRRYSSRRSILGPAPPRGTGRPSSLITKSMRSPGPSWRTSRIRRGMVTCPLLVIVALGMPYPPRIAYSA